jgi:hypothetical protein
MLPRPMPFCRFSLALDDWFVTTERAPARLE